MYVGLDFDGTLVDHCYPVIGGPIGAEPWLKQVAPRVRFILFTMRSGSLLTSAVAHIRDRMGLELYGVNHNPDQKSWTDSPKAYCHLYVDDAALGAPMVCGSTHRLVLDWNRAGPMLVEAVDRHFARGEPH